MNNNIKMEEYVVRTRKKCPEEYFCYVLKLIGILQPSFLQGTGTKVEKRTGVACCLWLQLADSCMREPSRGPAILPHIFTYFVFFAYRILRVPRVWLVFETLGTR